MDSPIKYSDRTRDLFKEWRDVAPFGQWRLQEGESLENMVNRMRTSLEREIIRKIEMARRCAK